MATNLALNLSRGQEEFDEWKCTQCEEVGRNNEASRFCLDCNEYYCDDCVKPHRRIPSLKTHKLLNEEQKNEFDQRHHQNEVALERKTKENDNLKDEIKALKEAASKSDAEIEQLREERDKYAQQIAQMTHECAGACSETLQTGMTFRVSHTHKGLEHETKLQHMSGNNEKVLQQQQQLLLENILKERLKRCNETEEALDSARSELYQRERNMQSVFQQLKEDNAEKEENVKALQGNLDEISKSYAEFCDKYTEERKRSEEKIAEMEDLVRTLTETKPKPKPKPKK